MPTKLTLRVSVSMAMSLCLYLFRALKEEGLETVSESLNSIDLSSKRMKKGKRRMRGVEKGMDTQDTHPFPRERGYVIDCLLLMI